MESSLAAMELRIRALEGLYRRSVRTDIRFDRVLPHLDVPTDISEEEIDTAIEAESEGAHCPQDSDGGERAMTLRVVGAGVGRTGTNSLKLALERLLEAPCYHMLELFGRPDDVVAWQRFADGESVEWDALFDGYAAAVDWPAAAAWRELASAYPDAIVVLSTRADPEAWWRSMEATIVAAWQRGRDQPADEGPLPGWGRMVGTLLGASFSADVADRVAMVAAYERHNAAVRAAVPAPRLVDWQPGDGWAPLCAALDVPVPDEPFPHVNTTTEFREHAGMGGA